jgi:hypothetical protein
MSNNPFTALQSRLTALAQEVSGNSVRAPQALGAFLSATAQAQFAYNRGLAEDLAEALTDNPRAAVPGLVKRWHDRSEQAIAAFRRINDDLRSSLFEAVAEPLGQIGTVAAETAQEIAEVAK